MDNAGGHRFEDPTEVSQTDLAPPSEQELVQQRNQPQRSSAQPGEEHSQNPPRERSTEDPSSAPQQVRVRCVDAVLPQLVCWQGFSGASGSCSCFLRRTGIFRSICYSSNSMYTGTRFYDIQV